MARLITGADAPTRTMTHTDRRRAHRRLERIEVRNPLRRVTLDCDTSARRDALAVLGDAVWCDEHGDFGRVVNVVE